MFLKDECQFFFKVRRHGRGDQEFQKRKLAARAHLGKSEVPSRPPTMDASWGGEVFGGFGVSVTGEIGQTPRRTRVEKGRECPGTAIRINKRIGPTERGGSVRRASLCLSFQDTLDRQPT